MGGPEESLPPAATSEQNPAYGRLGRGAYAVLRGAAPNAATYRQGKFTFIERNRLKFEHIFFNQLSRG